MMESIIGNFPKDFINRSFLKDKYFTSEGYVLANNLCSDDYEYVKKLPHINV